MIKIYACGECGHRFKPGMLDQLWIILSANPVNTSSKRASINMVCPKCKKRTSCSPSYDQRSEIRNS